jgi:hypothetical protein
MMLANRSAAGFFLSLLVLLLQGAPVSANEPPPYNCSILDGDREFQAHMLGDMTAVQQRRRVALVIGNGAYSSLVGSLANPSRDADAVSSKLRSLGFDVVLGKDVTAQQLMECGKRAAEFARGAELALLYYSGHGLQKDDVNFVVGVGASGSEVGLVALNDIVDPLREAAGSLLIFLDACRNNSLSQSGSMGLARAGGRSLKRGFVPVAEPSAASASRKGNLFIAYSTSPGRIAADGDGQLSPFTQGFVEHVGTPGLAIQDEIAKVTHSVNETSNYEQLPWSRSSLTSPVFLNGKDDRSVVLAKSRDFAAQARARLDKADRLGAIASALKGLPAVMTEDLRGEFHEAFKSLYGSVWSLRVFLPIDVGTVSRFAISNDRKRVLLERKLNFTASVTIELWDAIALKKIQDLFVSRTMASALLSFSADSSRAVVQEITQLGGYKTRANYAVYDASDGTRLFGLETVNKIQSYSYASGIVYNDEFGLGATLGRDAVIGDVVRLWDMRNGQLIKSISVRDIWNKFAPQNRMNSAEAINLAMDSAGDRLALQRGGNGDVLVLDIKRDSASFVAVGDIYCTLGASLDAAIIAVTCSNFGLRLFNVADGAILCQGLPREDAYYTEFVTPTRVVLHGRGVMDLSACLVEALWFDAFSPKDAGFQDGIVGLNNQSKVFEISWTLGSNIWRSKRGIPEGLELVPFAMQLLTHELRAEVERERIRYMPR